MNTLIKQTVYLPKDNSKTVFRPIDLPVEKTIRQEGYFFTTEELNQHIFNVIKDTLETAAKKSLVYQHSRDYKVSIKSPIVRQKIMISEVDKESIINTFEQTFQKYKL